MLANIETSSVFKYTKQSTWWRSNVRVDMIRIRNNYEIEMAAIPSDRMKRNNLIYDTPPWDNSRLRLLCSEENLQEINRQIEPLLPATKEDRIEQLLQQQQDRS